MTDGRVLAFDGDRFRVVTPGDDRVSSVAALRVDPRDGTLWGTAPDVFGRHDPQGAVLRKPSVVFQIDPATGRYLRIIELPAGAFANDLAFDADHNLYVTDSLGGQVLRLSPGDRAFERFVQHDLLGGGGLGAAGIAVAPDGSMYVGTYSAGRLLRIRGGHVETLRTPRPLRNPDGMRALPDGTLLVLEGNATGESGRLLRLKIDGLDAAVQEIAVVEMPLNLTLEESTVVVTDAAARPWLTAFLAGRTAQPPEVSRLRRIALPLEGIMK
ncbi:MAG: hypothetical protein AAF333_13545 [Planctomycetota bacterium]